MNVLRDYVIVCANRIHELSARLLETRILVCLVMVNLIRERQQGGIRQGDGGTCPGH